MHTAFDRNDHNHTRYGACPTYFRALCVHARAGGLHSYSAAGYELARHIDELGPYDVEDDEWSARVEQLERMLDDGDNDDAVIAWLRANVPRCLALVPKRRRHMLISGMSDCIVGIGGGE